jgi:hypothetical protein
MNRRFHRPAMSRLEALVKSGAVVAVVGAVALMSHLHPLAAGSPESAAAPVDDSLAATAYFPSQYPAPTEVADQPPTF